MRTGSAPDHDVVLGIEQEARALGLAEMEARARLLRARALGARNETTAAAGLLWEVNDWASAHEHTAVLGESHRELVWIYHVLGDPAAALDHAVRATELLGDTAPSPLRVQYLGTLGLALGWVRSFDAARERFAEAEQILASDDVPAEGGVYLLMNVLNNAAFNEHLAEEHEKAWEAAQRMLALASARAFAMNAVFVHTVALAQIGVGRFAEAEQTLLACLDRYDPHENQNPNDLAELVLGLAEVQRRQGDTDRAQATLDRCRDTCDERGLAEVKIRVQQEQAELYAAAGQLQRAFDAHKAFHAEAEALYSLERAAQSRIRAAIRETTEARRQARQFREQARRDPLTGVRNRRFVDEELPGLLDRAMRDWLPLSLALVDLDDFKRINDSKSHVVGDQVLVVVARLLTTAVATAASPAVAGSGFVARMGGDEFLVVLPGLEPAPARRWLEEARNTVGSYGWEPISGDVPVTVSIGAAATRLGQNTQSELLGRADEHLYAAKQPGRNGVVTDLDSFADAPGQTDRRRGGRTSRSDG